MEKEVLIKGSVSAVVYRNDENGYGVFRILSDGEEITAVGVVPFVQKGEFLEIKGIIINHLTYGEQIKIVSYQRSRPDNSADMLSFLASGMVKGIGIKTAEKIIAKFGDKSLSVIENDYRLLCEIRGITLAKARQISEEFKKQTSMGEISEYILKMGFDATVAIGLFKLYGKDAVSAFNENPYILSEGNFDVDFYKVDQFALALGIEADDERRIAGAVFYELMINAQSAGHSYLPEEKLTAMVSELLSVSSEKVAAVIERMYIENRIVISNLDGKPAVYLEFVFFAEDSAANRLYQMVDRECPEVKNINEMIYKIEQKNRIEYAPEQKQAISHAVHYPAFVLTGGPGTGKTTTIRGILETFIMFGQKVFLAAPTGRAAKKMSEFCGIEAKTVHRMLEMYARPGRNGKIEFGRNQNNPLDCDVLIVDEVSMVDIFLMSAILEALDKKTKLILVGDIDQLPSVGPGNVLKDIIGSGIVKTVKLEKIFRQAAESDIVVAAHEIKEGNIPRLDKKDNDFFFLKRKNNYDLTNTIIELVAKRLPNKMNKPSNQIQVISPSKVGQTGIIELNKRLQETLNPKSRQNRQIKFGETIFRTGDRVMQIRNNYDIEWHSKFGDQSGVGIFNGDIGEIIKIDVQAQVVTVCFDEKIMVYYSMEDLADLELAYAITVHKSQGSEFNIVILAAGGIPRPLLHRSVFYTAITRAKELLIIVGDEETIFHMVSNNKPIGRYSGLKARLLGFA